MRTILSANPRVGPVDVARSRWTGGTYLWCFGTRNLGAGDVDEARDGEAAGGERVEAGPRLEEGVAMLELQHRREGATHIT